MDWIVAACNVVIAASAAGGYLIARRWRQQVRFKSDYDCARSLLASILHVQEAIRAARFPGMYLDPESLEAERDQVFRERVKRLDEAVSDMRHSGIDADALWGRGKAQKILAPLMECYGELVDSIFDYCNASGTHYARRSKEGTEDFQRLQATVYGLGGAKDVFHKKVVEAVSQAEDFLRPKIEFQK